MKRRYISMIAIAAIACSNLYAQTAFKASNVWMYNNNANQGYMTLLGENKYGQQLWYKKTGTGDQSLYVYVDDRRDFKLTWSNSSYHKGSLDNNNMSYSPFGPLGAARHFILMVGETNVFYAGYQTKGWYYQTPGGDYNITAKVQINATTPKLSEATGDYYQYITMNVNGITKDALDDITIMGSYDDGNTWTTVTPTSTDKIYNGTQIQFKAFTYLPSDVKKVRYYAIAKPLEEFNIVVADDDEWRSDTTEDFTIPVAPITSTLTVDNVKDSYTDATSITKRTYSPTVTWSIPEVFKSKIEKAAIEYSAYGTGDEWATLFTTTDISGSQQVSIPVAADTLLFRMKVTPKADALQFTEGVSAEQLVDNAFHPAFSSITLTGSLNRCHDDDKGIFTPTLAYAMNDDLYQTRIGKAFIYASSDDGATWSLQQTLDNPGQSGEVKLSLSDEHKSYMFRMGMATAVNNAIEYGVEGDSKVFAYTPVYVLDDNIDYTAEASTDRDVKVLRSFVGGSMATICLPFALTAEQITEGFGADAEVYQYTSLNGTTMNFTKVTAMEAGTPYLVKTAENKDNLYFTGIDIDSSTKPQPSTVSDSYVFTGTFSPYLMATDKSELFLTTSGRLKYPSTSADNANRLRGYRGYFKVSDANLSLAKISINDELTGICVATINDDAPVRVYNLNGQLVGDSLEGLPNGVYVVNQKKVVVNK